MSSAAASIADICDAPIKAVPARSTRIRMRRAAIGPEGPAAADRRLRPAARTTGDAFSLTIIGDGEMRADLEAEISRRKLLGIS